MLQITKRSWQLQNENKEQALECACDGTARLAAVVRAPWPLGDGVEPRHGQFGPARLWQYSEWLVRAAKFAGHAGVWWAESEPAGCAGTTFVDGTRRC